MRLVAQRVTQASLVISGKIVGKIGSGLVVFVAIGVKDTKNIAEKMAQKIVNLRVFADSKAKMNLSLKEVKGGLLVIPQFTLYASLKGQNRPFFGEAAKPEEAKKLFNYFFNKIKSEVEKVESGEFGAFMQVNLTNDGPVTIIIDSKEF